MNLVCAILSDAQVGQVLDALTAAGHHATRVSSTGGFMRRGNTTLLIGVEREQLQAVLTLIHDVCRGNKPKGTGNGGATVFVLDVERFQQI